MISKKTKIISLIGIILFGLNFTPLYAQDMFIDVIGGGYKLQGPGIISLQPKHASFEIQTARADIRNPLTVEPAQLPYIEITDENGGNGFTLSVDVTNFTGDGTISKSSFFLKNCDQSPEQAVCKTTLEGQGSWLSLDPSTDDFVSFGSQSLVLATGSGSAPGKWRIYPSFQLEIPAKTPPGQYTSTITFTIS
jgi:hypothetical protein